MKLGGENLKRLVLSSGSLGKYVNQIVDLVGSDATEQQCETACTEVITDALLSTSCPFICQSFQSLVGNLHVNQPAQVQKRFLESLLSSGSVGKYVNQIVDLVGSDATEQQCETACTEVITDALLSTSCPFICQSFKSLVGNLHVNQPAQVQKRFLESLAAAGTGTACGSVAVTGFAAAFAGTGVGARPTGAAPTVASWPFRLSGRPKQSLCRLIAGFKALVGNLHVNQPAQVQKRFLESLLSSGILGKYVNQIVDLVGSDATEQQCETACTEVITDALLSTSCPFLCQSFQSLVGNLHVNQPAQVQKRFLEVLNSGSMGKYVNQIVDLVGSDATEQQCETACDEVITDPVLSTSCPFLCQS
ncbi:hypothetical protein BaRGS_00010353, partial [Batillaria attramentaria]